MFSRRTLGLVILAAATVYCGSNNPSGPEVTPTPTPSPSPTPQPTPTPAPTPTPSPTPAGNYNPAVSVSTILFGFLHNGQLQNGERQFYSPGDVLYLTCTPKDKNGKPTKNHGRLQDWIIDSPNLQNGTDFFATDTIGFNPDIHVSDGSPNGQITAKCRVDFMTSGLKVMNIGPPE